MQSHLAGVSDQCNITFIIPGLRNCCSYKGFPIFPLFSNMLSGTPGWMVCWSEKGSSLKSCLTSCYLTPLCGQEWLFVQWSGSKPCMTWACAKVIQILAKFWATVQMHLEFLWATGIPCHALKSFCYGQNWLRDWSLSNAACPRLRYKTPWQTQSWPPTHPLQPS